MLQAFRVPDVEQFGEAGLDLLRVAAGQDLAPEREVEGVHPALIIPMVYCSYGVMFRPGRGFAKA